MTALLETDSATWQPSNEGNLDNPKNLNKIMVQTKRLSGRSRKSAIKE
jgi:hypothetical protein